MLERFYTDGKKQGYWQSGTKVLVAVSGGIDSMVLVTLMEAVAKREAVTFSVAYVNHQLRPESEQEAAYLRNYCQQKNIPFFETAWNRKEQERESEAAARKFRYAFFEKVMNQASMDVLMTAHHADDQAETIFMKLVRGTALVNAGGIRPQQPFARGQLVRPLLQFSKVEIQQFATAHQLVYFDDQTNQSEKYFRNRIRKQIIPPLKEENPQLLTHLADFNQQLSYANQVIQETVRLKFAELVTKEEDGWEIHWVKLARESEGFRYFFMTELLQQALINQHYQVSQRQVQQIMRLLNGPKPQGAISLEGQWVFRKQYDQAFLEQQVSSPVIPSVVHRLSAGDQLFLDNHTWIALVKETETIDIPTEVTDWQSQEIPFSLSDSALPLQVRHRKTGDEIKLKPGYTKKLRRLFIDLKVSSQQRAKTWIVSTAEDEIICVPGFVNSYLSILKETDKIHYRLLFRTKE